MSKNNGEAMYYIFLPGVCLCLIFNIYIILSKDIDKKFNSFDYKSSMYLRSDRSIDQYIEDIDLLTDRVNMSFYIKTLPPYSDYSIYNWISTGDKRSSLLKLFEEKIHE